MRSCARNFGDRLLVPSTQEEGMRTGALSRHAVTWIATGLLAACTSTASRPAAKSGVHIDSLVTTEWLSRHLDEPDLVVLDCTVRAERGADGRMRPVNARADY